MRYLLILSFLICFAGGVALGGQTLVLTPQGVSYPLGLMVDTLEDPQGKLTVEQVASPQNGGRFTANGKPNLSLGMTTSAYWLRMRISNMAETEGWLLEIAYPQLEWATLYAKKTDGEFKSYEAGNLTPPDQKAYPHRNPVFPLWVGKGESRDYYLRVQSGSGLTLPLTLYDPDEFVHKDLVETFFSGACYGLLLIMALYNLFLFASIRDWNYLWYSLFVVAFTLLLMVGSGWGLVFFWPRQVVFNNNLAGMLAFAAFPLGLWFVRQFLNTAMRTPRLDLVLLALMGLMASGMALRWLVPPIASTIGLYLMTPLLFIMAFAASLTVVRRGYPPAAHISLGWLFLMAGGISYALVRFGLLPGNLFTLYGMQMGAVADVALFSLALGSRYNIIRQEKEQAQTLARANLLENVLLKKEITRREKAEAQLLKAKDQAEQATRLKDKFVSLVAHDARAPVAAIMVMAQAMEEDNDPAPAPVHRELAESIRKRGGQFIRMMEELLNLNRLQTGKIVPKMEPFNGWEVVDEVFLLKHLAQAKAIKLINDVAESTQMTGDRQLIFEVIQNLVSNAVKFTPRGGEIRVSAPTGPVFTLTVQDTGQGVPAEYLPYLFNPEEKTSSPGTEGERGTGLGLPLCHEIMTAHGGNLWVESIPGKGSVFFAQWPKTNRETPPPGSRTPQKGGGRKKGGTPGETGRIPPPRRRKK
ncbi:MAG: sensor histidine kinase [Deltaproteobacteria bacterium]|nr:sensor histidine kinase [Deltaproteobacteria bacterium]